jgi:hypothetical protein
MAGNTHITDMAAAAALTGAELLETSQLSRAVTITAATLSAQASDNSFNDSGAGFVAAGFAVNDRVNVVGFTGNVANNIFVGKITALAAGKMTIGGSDGDVIVDDAAGESVTITKWVTRRASAQEVAGRVRTETTSEAIAAGNFVSYHNAGGAKVRKANATDDTKPVNAFAPAAIGKAT